MWYAVIMFITFSHGVTYQSYPLLFDNSNACIEWGLDKANLVMEALQEDVEQPSIVYCYPTDVFRGI